MDLFNNMNVNSGLMNYEQFLSASESTEGKEKDKEDVETTEAKTDPVKDVKPKGVTTYNPEEDNSTEDSSEGSTTKTKEIKDPEVYKSLLKAHADYLGIDVDVDAFEGGAKEMTQFVHDMYSNLMDEEIEEVKTTFFSPMQKRFVDMVDTGVDQDEALDFFKDYKKIDSLDVEEMDDKTAKEVYKVYLKKTTRFSDSKINDEISELEDLGSLVDKTKKVVPELKETFRNEEKEKLRLAKLEQDNYTRAQLKGQEDLKEFLNSTEEIAGIKLNKVLKDKWKAQYQLIPNEQGKLVTPIQALQAKDPQGLNAYINLLMAAGMFNYDNRRRQFVPDFKLLKTISKNDVFDEVEKAINKQKSKEASESGKGIDEMDFTPDKKTEIERLLKLGEKYNNL